jgi:hypothetical protein
LNGDMMLHKYTNFFFLLTLCIPSMAVHRHVQFYLPPRCLQNEQCSQPICYTLSGFQPCSAEQENMCDNSVDCMEYVGTYISIKSRCINRQCRVFPMETQLRPPKTRLRNLLGQKAPKKEDLKEKIQKTEELVTPAPQVSTVSPTPVTTNDSEISNLGAFGISMVIIAAVTFVCFITLLLFYFGTRKPKKESSLDKTASAQFNLPPPPAESPPQTTT